MYMYFFWSDNNENTFFLGGVLEFAVGTKKENIDILYRLSKERGGGRIVPSKWLAAGSSTINEFFQLVYYFSC